MPAKSKAQFRFMQAAAHSPSFAAKAGISRSVAKEFVARTASPKRLPARVAKKGKR